MVISTIQALFATALALIPGALYLFSYERVSHGYGVKLADRIVRIFGASAVMHVLMSPGTYWIYKHWIVTGLLAKGRVDAVAVFVGAIGYVGTPIVVGSVVATAYRKYKTTGHRRWAWSTWIVGRSPEPRAWDFVWQIPTAAVVRMRLKSGLWLAGLWHKTPEGEKSWASSYTEDEADLYLRCQIRVDPKTGVFGGAYVVKEDVGLLVRWSEIEFIEHIKWR